MAKSTDFRNDLRSGIAILAGATLVVDLLLLAQPLYMLQVYDRVLPSGSLETLLYISLLAVAALTLLAIADGARSILASRIATRLGVKAGSLAFDATMRSGRSDLRISQDLGTVRGFIGGKGLLTLLDLPFAPIFVAILYLIHPILFVVTVIGGAVLVLVAIANRYATARSAKEAGNWARTSNDLMGAFARASGTIKAMGMTNNALAAWGALEAKSLVAQDRGASTNARFAGLSRSVRLALQFAILGVGGYLVLAGEMTAGMIFAASMISGRALQPVDGLVAGWSQIAEARAAWKRVDPLLDDSDTEEPIALPEPTGRIEIDRLVVTAGPSRNPVLKGITASIPAGACIAIIGPSGSGKSTLARAIVGAVERQSGAIRIDGSDIANWNRDQLGSRTGYLDQNVDLLPGTVARNIARFDPNPTGEAIVEAAMKAQVHELVAGLPDGYATTIGENGHVLSGGQRQRVALARAFYGNPKIMILDEPNAALDAEGDAALDRAILEAKASGTTVVIVTQRTSAVRNADAIMIMRDGTIADYGPRDEVARRLAGETAPAPVQVPDAASPARRRAA